MTAVSAPGSPRPTVTVPRFEERVGVRGRAWWWLAVIIIVTFFAVAPVAVPLAIIAWFINVGRFARTRVVILDDWLQVGKRAVPLAALDCSTIGQAGNTWPWRTFDRRYLGANPVWSRDSVAVRGIDAGGVYRIAVGTNRRDELVAALRAAIDEAHRRVGRARAWTSPPAWHPDPWAPTTRLRWWDGDCWTGYAWPPDPPVPPAAPLPSGPSSEAPSP
jgi:hypothetical protein